MVNILSQLGVMVKTSKCASRNVIVSATHLLRRWAAWTRTLGGWGGDRRIISDWSVDQTERGGGQQVRRQLRATAGANIPAISTPNITVVSRLLRVLRGRRCSPEYSSQHLLRRTQATTYDEILPFGSYAEIRRRRDFCCVSLFVLYSLLVRHEAFLNESEDSGCAQSPWQSLLARSRDLMMRNRATVFYVRIPRTQPPVWCRKEQQRPSGAPWLAAWPRCPFVLFLAPLQCTPAQVFLDSSHTCRDALLLLRHSPRSSPSPSLSSHTPLRSLTVHTPASSLSLRASSVIFPAHCNRSSFLLTPTAHLEFLIVEKNSWSV